MCVHELHVLRQVRVIVLGAFACMQVRVSCHMTVQTVQPWLMTLQRLHQLGPLAPTEVHHIPVPPACQATLPDSSALSRTQRRPLRQRHAGPCGTARYVDPQDCCQCLLLLVPQGDSVLCTILQCFQSLHAVPSDSQVSVASKSLTAEIVHGDFQ